MISTRVGIQLREALLGTTSSNENKDLAATVEKFNAYKLKLNSLVKALHAQHSAMKHLNESRLLVSECISELAKQTPLSQFAGVKRTNEETQSLKAVNNGGRGKAESDPNTLLFNPSFYSIHESAFRRRQSEFF